MNWRKASYSSGNGGNCVEIGDGAGMVGVRDTKNNGTGPLLEFTPDQWEKFTRAVKHS